MNYTVYIRQVRKYQKNPHLLLNNFFKELFEKRTRLLGYRSDDSVSKKALNILQTSLESYLVNLLENANLFAIHDGRVDVQPRDLQIARRMAEGPR